jgi:hypothetical protein
MKKQILIFVILCSFVGLSVVPAYTQDVEFRARIPFSFVVLGKTFPPGEYRLSAAPHMVKLEDSKGTLVATALANEIVGRSANATSQIIFHCYNEVCFLSELRSVIPGNSRQVLTSQAEAELAKKEQGKYLALIGEKRRR